MVIYVLLLSEIALLIVLLMLYRGDILDPSIIIVSTFLFSSLCALYSIDLWKMALSWTTYWVIFGGILVFCLGGAFIRLCGGVLHKQNKKRQINFIVIEKDKLGIFMMATIAIAIIYAYFIFKIARQAGANGSWSIIMNVYRTTTSHSLSEDSIPTIVTYLFRLCIMGGYIILYVLVNNYLITKRIDKGLLVSLLTILGISLLSGGRTDIMRFICAGITLYFVLYHRFKGWIFRFKPRQAGKIIIGILALAVLFYLLKGAVGRLNQTTLFYYISYYVGGSIELLDLFIKDPPLSSDVFGKETFYGIYSFIGPKTGNSDWIYTIHKEFRTSNGILIGNVYTMFRSYLYDFGSGGMVILVFLFSMIVSLWYMKIRTNKKKNCRTIDVSLLIYAFLSHTIFMSFFAEEFYVTFFSFTMIRNILSLIVVYCFMFKVRICG